MHGATLHLENGNTFTINVKNQSDKNVYMKEARLKGQKLRRPFLAHQAIMQGWELTFVMAAKLTRK